MSVSTLAARRPTLLPHQSREQLSARLMMTVLVGKVRAAASVAQLPQHTSSVKHSDTRLKAEIVVRVRNIHFNFRSLCKL